MLIPAGNLTTTTLHKEPPLIRDTTTCHKGSSLMAGGGAFYLNFDTGQCKISFNPFISVEKDDVVQCCIPYGRWWCSLFEFWHWVNIKYHLNHHKQCRGLYKLSVVQPLWEVGGLPEQLPRTYSVDFIWFVIMQGECITTNYIMSIISYHHK